MRVKVKI